MGLVRGILLTQLIIALLLPLALLAVDKVTAFSALLGGLIAWLPNAYMAARLFLRPHVREDPGVFLRAAYFAEFGKFLMTAALFTAVFIGVRPLQPGALFLGFIASLAAWWVGIWLGRDNTTQGTEQHDGE